MNESLPRIVFDVSTAVTDRHFMLRAGQAAFNELYRIRPDLANEIRGRFTTLDPFYRDENLPAFYEWLTERVSLEKITHMTEGEP